MGKLLAGTRPEWGRRPAGRPAYRGDRGRVSIFLAIAFFGVIAAIGVAVDASGQFRTLMRADNLASEAARAAGQGIDGPAAMQGNEVVVDPALAVQYADDYLDTAMASVDQQAVSQVQLAPDGTAVEVTVTITYETRVLGMFGYNTIDVTGESTAVLVTG